MSEKNKIRTIEDIRAERLRIKERRQSIESNFLFSASNEESSGFQMPTVFGTIKNFVFNRFINKSDSSSLEKTSVHPIMKSIGKFDKWGIVSILSQFITHPTARTALSFTKKSFIKWQLFNASILLLKWGYNAYKKHRLNKKYEDAIVIKD